MSGRIGVPRPRALAIKGGTFAAATVLAGAGVLGVAAVGPEVAGAQSVQAQVALAAYPTFAESLQTLLDNWNVGSLDELLGKFGMSLDSSIASLLADLNTSGLTLEGIANTLGFSLSEPLYSSTVTSLLGSGSIFLVNGVPIGNTDLGDVLDYLMGAPGSGDHSLSQLASALGMGSLLSQYSSMINALGLDNMNYDYCTLHCGDLGNILSHPDLNVNSSLTDWLSGILKVPTVDVEQAAYAGTIFASYSVLNGSAYTLGEYLHTVPVSSTDSTPMDQALVGNLLGLTPGQTWDSYLSNLPIGGSIFDPSGVTLGSLTLGGVLDDLLPAGSAPIDTMSVTDFLGALGLFNW
ncbi:hypothetical protein [[Mycobacterium] zoologicum]|uniref:hypothetical protein n=1 Tax=[Mycobacterium] zoologicum TaxID=2872311 RepID=UPI001CDB104A|nr:hypothetical protein [Mycolicibacter sp. MYC101]MEB3064344.1 hypothetical protein [Mycolicibacter sp. MYC101]